MTATPPARTLLPHALALLYGLSIIYVSLQPFGEWMERAPGTPFFLFAPWPARWFRYDAALNVVAYLPFGFFVALLPRRATPLARTVLGAIAGSLLSFSMETLQMYLPQRIASTVDLISNTFGALLGGALGAALARADGVKRVVAYARARLFLRGMMGDIGLALLALWLIAQINPGIPLFAVTFDPEPGRILAASPHPEGAALLIEAAESAFQLLGVGLFLALLLRQRRYVGGAVLVLIGGALLLKGIAASLVIRPAIWESWQRPGVLLGIAAGALVIPAAIHLPRPVQVAACAVALLSSVGTPLLAPGLLEAGAPLTLFNWRYGQLLNYNGLTRTILLVWPILASAWLFALAGSPAWGRPD